MPDALSKLPEFQWRGKKYPLSGHNWLRRWEVVPSQTPSCQFQQLIGPTNWRFDYTIPMRNGVAAKQYGDGLFQALIELFRDCDNRERGPIVDPIWGEWQCVATEFSGETDPERRDGVDVKVVFVHKPEQDDPDQQITGGLLSVAGLQSDAGRLDQEIAKAFYARQQPPPEPLVNPLDAISGLGSQLERQGDRISQSLHSFARRCEKLEATFSRLKGADTLEIRRALRRNRAAAHKLLRQTQDSVRATRVIVTRSAKDALAIARDSGMTTQQFLDLNPTVVNTPKVPQGTRLVVFTR